LRCGLVHCDFVAARLCNRSSICAPDRARLAQPLPAPSSNGAAGSLLMLRLLRSASIASPDLAFVGPSTLLFADVFERGDTSEWSSTGS
jgi:hypothetical protein